MAIYLFFSHEKANLCMLNPHRKKRGWAKTTERQQELFKLLHHLAHYGITTIIAIINTPSYWKKIQF